MMQSKKCIGRSQFATLILAGNKGNGMCLEQLRFSNKGRYHAAIVDANESISSQYEQIAEFYNWLKVYDDEGISLFLRGEKIIIYKNPVDSCIIKVVAFAS